MKQFARMPLLSAAILALPLWIVLGNFIVAAMVALFAAFLASMIHSLHVLKRKDAADPDTADPGGERH